MYNVYNRIFNLASGQSIETFYVGLSPEDNRPMWVTKSHTSYKTVQDDNWERPTLNEMRRILQNDDLKKHFLHVSLMPREYSHQFSFPLVGLKREDNKDGVPLYDLEQEAFLRSGSMSVVSSAISIFVKKI